MKHEKYMKALDEHGDKLIGYAKELRDLVREMRIDHCSVNDVVGMLETEKMNLLGRETAVVGGFDGIAEAIGAILGEEE